ncbi:lysophospholipid acyltransferase family protein [Sediminitomix flava]|uniref:1-acyl-sn-glycerol-3-phosphate acyltransferase n=1 Tax=Sediminitomix flava TaxID=379075 RepID=A0A315ZDD7_SEDFL|nr:lysophospholipid acyltransferase family protein [Sediminitomix flava]PWJ43133.1 1-acyl-sn-glycerol-3-phosphate acyltransferase [Sediminitomix flava]
MIAILKKIYLFWGLFGFLITMLVLFPIYALLFQFPNWKHHYSCIRFLNKYWSYSLYFFTFNLPKIEFREGSRDHNTKVYVANHTSFMDIPLMGATSDQLLIFMGKHSLAKIPLFGWIFSKTHIVLDRNSRDSAKQAYVASKEMIDKGLSVAIYPEGTQNRKPPKVRNFKDGAFKIAIEKQIPIQPVSIIDNWVIWPRLAPELNWSPCRIVYHEPIPTKGLSSDDIENLKEQVIQTINTELEKYYPHYFETNNELTLPA